MIIPPDIETMTEEQLRASLRQLMVVCAQQKAEIARLMMFLSMPDDCGVDHSATVH